MFGMRVDLTVKLEIERPAIDWDALRKATPREFAYTVMATTNLAYEENEMNLDLRNIVTERPAIDWTGLWKSYPQEFTRFVGMTTDLSYKQRQQLAAEEEPKGWMDPMDHYANIPMITEEQRRVWEYYFPWSDYLDTFCLVSNNWRSQEEDYLESQEEKDAYDFWDSLHLEEPETEAEKLADDREWFAEWAMLEPKYRHEHRRQLTAKQQSRIKKIADRFGVDKPWQLEMLRSVDHSIVSVKRTRKGKLKKFGPSAQAAIAEGLAEMNGDAVDRNRPSQDPKALRKRKLQKLRQRLRGIEQWRHTLCGILWSMGSIENKVASMTMRCKLYWADRESVRLNSKLTIV